MLYLARLQTEALIDELPAQRPLGCLKHRTYREKLKHKMESNNQNPQTSGKNKNDPLFSLLVGFDEAFVTTSGVF